jgi:DHA2 family multidrug resistance protein-like MFS transporter
VSSSITNTALPTIVTSFHITSAQSIWVVNGVQLATTMTLLFFGAASDARGAKRLYLSGMLLFALATVGCALAPTFEVLVLMRVLQGLGGSAVIVTVNTLNRALFPPEQLGRALAVNTIFVAVGSVSGPTIGGLILVFASWPGIFAFTVPFAIAALALGWRYLPHIPPSGAKLDYPSAGLAAVAFGALFYALDAFARPHPGLGDAAFGAAGVIAMGLFVHRQLHLTHPMLAVELFRVPIFSVSIVASAATYGAQTIAYVSLPFYFQNVLGKSPWQSGLLLSAWPFASLIVAMQMGRLSDRHPAPVLCTLGILVMGAGLAGFALLPAMPAVWMIVTFAGIAGAGFATFQTPNNRAILITAPHEKTGRAAAVMTTARVTGQTLGAVIVAIVFGAGGTPTAALLAACTCIAIAAVLSSIRLRAQVAFAP